MFKNNYLLSQAILNFKKTAMANQELFLLKLRIIFNLRIFLILHPGTQMLDDLGNVIGFYLLEPLA